MKKLLGMLLMCTMLTAFCTGAFAEEPAVKNGELLDIAQVMVKAAMNKAEEINGIIALSTCSYEYDDARYVLVCVPVMID